MKSASYVGPVFRRVENDPELFGKCAAMMAGSEPWLTLRMTHDQCLAAFHGECKEIHLLEEDGQVAGFVILQMCGTFRGYIQTLFVAAPFRGRGLSKVLLAFCEARILPLSPNMFLCVSSFNETAKKIYLDWGFKPVGVLHDLIREGFDEILLRKSVGPLLK